MSASPKETKKIARSNQPMTYELRPRENKQARPSTIVLPESRPAPKKEKQTNNVSKKRRKQTNNASKKRQKRKNNNEENEENEENDHQFIMLSPKRKPKYDFIELENYTDFLRLDELEELELFKDENVDETGERCPFCNIVLPDSMSDKMKSSLELIKKGKISAIYFCFTHFAETSVVPDGAANNYPFEIDFDKLPARIHKFKDDLLNIINGTTDSYYRNYALKYYKKNGRRKSASTLGLLNRFEELRAGYYGTKGTLIISDVLVKLFLTTRILTSKNAAPLKPEDYMMEILIPETAMRLIHEDQGSKGSLESARKLLVSSSNFGDWVHNDDDV